MDSISYPRGLIKYASQHSLQNEPTRLVKAKNIGYAATLLLTIVVLVWSVMTRSDVEMHVQQVRQPLSVTLSDGRIQNRYDIKINNKTSKDQQYRISIEGLNNAELDVGNFTVVTLLPQHSVTINAKVRMAVQDAKGSQQDFTFVINSIADEKLRIAQPSLFYIPEKYFEKH